MMLLNTLQRFATSVWVEQIGWTLLHSLWQIALIASAYYLLSFLLRKSSAYSRYIIGCAALVAMLVVPVTTFCLLSDQQAAAEYVVDQNLDLAALSPSLDEVSLSQAAVEPAFAESGSLADNTIGVESGDSLLSPQADPADVLSVPEEIASVLRPWLPLTTVSWLVGVALLSMRPVVGCLYIRRLRRFGLSPVPDAVLQACDELMRKMKIQHAVQLFQSSLVHSPVVVGYLRPMILLPASAITGLTARELELILAHELAHIRKHDYLVNLVQTVIEALLFYHPGTWWMSAQVRRERENCCDDVAVAISSDRATYIRALALLEQQRVASPALAATGGALLNRVRRLVGGPGSEFVYRKSSLWLTALLLVGVAITGLSLTGANSMGMGDDVGLTELSREQMEVIASRVQAVADGKIGVDVLIDELQEIGPESVQGLVPFMARGVADGVAMDAFEPFLDQPRVRAYLEEVLVSLPVDLSKPGNQSHCCLTLLAKCPHRLHPKSSEFNHVNLCGKFLKWNPHAALYVLGGVKGEHAREQLLAAFEQLPTERWWLVANALERTGDAAAVPELKRRLREIESPPSDRFPNITVSAFTNAIYKLSRGEHTNRGFRVGRRSVYPYDGPGTPRSFTVAPGTNHYISLPDVDSSTDDGRTQIWQAIRDQTPGPGFIIDGDEIVLLHGLKVIPLDLGKSAKPVDFDKYLCEKTIEEFKRLFLKTDSSGRVAIPSGDWILAMDPASTLYLLRLRKTSDDSPYNVLFSRRLPLMKTNAMTQADSDLPDGEESLLNFDKLVGRRVAQAIRNVNLPFVDEQKLQKIEKDFTSFINSSIPKGTYAVGASIPKDQRHAILRAIKEHGAQHLGIDRFRQAELRSINSAYLELPDRLLTLKWKLYRAIVNARTLDVGKQAKLEAQRLWMKQYVRSLPAYKTDANPTVLSALEERFADPLCCTLSYPMTDKQFTSFKQHLKKRPQESEPASIVFHIVQQSQAAQYEGVDRFELPFDDRVVRYGAASVVQLGFKSNRSFVGSMRSIQDIEDSGTVIDATTGNLITAPEEAQKGNDFQRWLSKNGRGDFGFDDADGGGLFSIRDAKLVKLDVKTWHQADAISSKELRALLGGPSAGQTISLKNHYQDYQQENGAPCCYVGVLTNEGRLAVVAVESFSGRKRIGVRTRVRAALSEMETEELRNTANKDAAEKENAIRKELEFLAANDGIEKETMKATREGDWGEATEGVQLKIHSLDVHFVNGQWRVECRTDIRSNEERVLPHYGAPIDEYLIEWDGKWYRQVDRRWSLVASVFPSPALKRDSMYTVIRASKSPALDHRSGEYGGWVDEATGKPMSLTAGTHTLRIALPLADPPGGAENQQSQKRAVSNKIEFTVPAKQPDAVTWGPENDGLQLGIDAADVQAMRNWQPGSKLSYTLWIKNASDQPMPVTDFIPLRGWYPELRDKDGSRVALPMPPINRPVQIRERRLAGGAIVEVGKLFIDMPATFEPGAYSLKQDYRITSGSRDRFPLEVSVDLRIGELARGKAIGDVKIGADHSLRIEGDHNQSGTVSGKVEGDFETYSVFLEHDNWKGNLGDLPQLVVKSGETYEFTNVPVGSCVVMAKPVLARNKDKYRAATLTKTVEVKDDQTVTADLLADSNRTNASADADDVAALSEKDSARTIKVPKWPRIPSRSQSGAFHGFGSFHLRDDDDQTMGRKLIFWDDIKPVDGQLHIPAGKALGIGIDSGNYTDLSALLAFAPNGLQSLSLPSQNMIDNRAMPNLAQLTGLKRLLLGGSTITDKGLPHLVKLTNLKYLSLQQCPVTDQSIDTLAQFTSLQEINLWNTWVSKQGAEKLQLALPNCRVEWTEATERVHPSLDPSGNPLAKNEQDAPKAKRKATNLTPVFASATKLRWDRLKPNSEHARVLRQWDDIAYEKARAIGINKTSALSDIWEAVPPESKSYEVRKDVRVTIAALDTTIYERPDLKKFWVQRDPPESSSHTYFGPFDGDPFEVLGIQPNQAKNRMVGQWIGGGAIMPVFHAFLSNGVYERRIGERTANPNRGTWRLEDNRLIRQIDGQEESTSAIEWTGQNAFRIELPNDKSAVYRRVDPETGKVILPDVSERTNPTTVPDELHTDPKQSSTPLGDELDDAWHQKSPLEFSDIKQISSRLPANGDPCFLSLDQAALLDASDPRLGTARAPEQAQNEWAVSQGLPFEFRSKGNGVEFRAYDTQSSRSQKLSEKQLNDTVFGKYTPRQLLQTMYDTWWASIRFDMKNQNRSVERLRNQTWTIDSESLPVSIQFRGRNAQAGILFVQSYDSDTGLLDMQFKTIHVASDVANTDSTDSRPAPDESQQDD